MLKIVSRDEQKQDLRRKMLKIVSTDEQKQDLRQKMLKFRQVCKCHGYRCTYIETALG